MYTRKREQRIQDLDTARGKNDWHTVKDAASDLDHLEKTLEGQYGAVSTPEIIAYIDEGLGLITQGVSKKYQQPEEPRFEEPLDDEWLAPSFRGNTLQEGIVRTSSHEQEIKKHVIKATDIFQLVEGSLSNKECAILNYILAHKDTASSASDIARDLNVSEGSVANAVAFIHLVFTSFFGSQTHAFFMQYSRNGYRITPVDMKEQDIILTIREPQERLQEVRTRLRTDKKPSGEKVLLDVLDLRPNEWVTFEEIQHAFERDLGMSFDCQGFYRYVKKLRQMLGDDLIESFILQKEDKIMGRYRLNTDHFDEIREELRKKKLTDEINPTQE